MGGNKKGSSSVVTEEQQAGREDPWKTTFTDALLWLETTFRLIFFSSSFPPVSSIFHVRQWPKLSKPKKFKPSEEGKFASRPFSKCLVSLHPIPSTASATSPYKSNKGRAWMFVKTLWGKYWIFSDAVRCFWILTMYFDFAWVVHSVPNNL